MTDKSIHYIVTLGVCLICSSIGFRRTVYFVSLGYALSIAVLAFLLGTLYFSTISGWPLLQAAILLLYAIRLGGFLLVRSHSRGFQKEREQEWAVGIRLTRIYRVGIWCGVSLLYALLCLPTLLTLAAQASGHPSGSTPAGVAVMSIGLLLEAMADWQKSHFKRSHTEHFCTASLYRFVRYPNYLGEMVFWLGTWFSALSDYQTGLQWALSTLGMVCMMAVMLDAPRRLEAKQAKQYGAEAPYRLYTRTVPVLFPLIPLYSLRAVRPDRP
jgi:steroid 5-alpha reductase family enzyme